MNVSQPAGGAHDASAPAELHHQEQLEESQEEITTALVSGALAMVRV